MDHYSQFTNKTIQLVPVDEECSQDCDSCAVSALNCGNNASYCSKPRDSIWIFAEGSADPIDVYVSEVRKILKEYHQQYFGFVNDDESFVATILQKSMTYSDVKLRIFKIDTGGVITLHEDILAVEEEIKMKLYDIVRKMPEGTILNVRTYTKNIMRQKSQVIDFTIKRVFSLT